MNDSWIKILSLLVIISQLASAKVLLMRRNTFLSFDDVKATFTPIVESSGEWGLLYTAKPLDACFDLANKVDKGSKSTSSYVLIIRGGCSFEEKVRKAQRAGYKAAIVYNDRYDELLVPMAGNSSGVHIHGVLVTRASGEVLKGYAGQPEMEVWLIPGFGTSSLSIMAITFISLLVMSAVLSICFFFCKHRIRQWRVAFLSRGSRRLPKNLIQQIPTQVFAGVLDVGSTSVICAICIDDYCVGDKLRILPCQHKFHAACIDSWLCHWRSICPVCKHDARTGTSERTPLLSPSLNSTASLQSLPIPIRQDPLPRSTLPQAHTVPICHTQDLRNAFSQRYMYKTRPATATSSWIRSSSSSMHEHLLDQSESVGSSTLFPSANSLPSC